MEITDPKDRIHRLIKGIEGYNPKHLPILEKHLAWQIKESEYDFEANLAMLRMYQFAPELFNVDAVKLILLKAIANLPSTDLTLCKYLIQTDRLMEEPLCTVVDLGNLLETCQFHKFWEALEENPEVAASIADWESSVRSFIAYVIDTTYQRISKSLLMSLLNISSDEELELVLKGQKWQPCPPSPEDTLAAGDQWIFITNHEASVKSTKIKEKVTFAAMASMANAFKPSVGEFFIQAIPKHAS
uniref:Eukaryotic translation initiation factor 3 subunit K n=1 Tax=Schistocephalus solidus TaxID=70667 RepID=A0A0X3NJF5_SCHSO